MPMCDIKDHKTGETLKAYDFGGPEVYYAGTSLVYAPLGGTSVSASENLATLQPLGITSIMKPRWEVTGHTNVGTANWRVSVVDTSTGETKDGVYPFNLQGNVYELECQPGTWVMASCGGYKIESSWSGQQSYEVYRLKGTGEKIYIIDYSKQPKPSTYYNTLIIYNFSNVGPLIGGTLVDWAIPLAFKIGDSQMYRAIPKEFPVKSLIVETLSELIPYYRYPPVSTESFNKAVEYFNENKESWITTYFNNLRTSLKVPYEVFYYPPYYSSGFYYIYYSGRYSYGTSGLGILDYTIDGRIDKDIASHTVLFYKPDNMPEAEFIKLIKSTFNTVYDFLLLLPDR